MTFFKRLHFSVLFRSGTDGDILALNYAGFVPVVLEGLKQLDRIVSAHRIEVKDKLEGLDNITSRLRRDVENTSQEVDARSGEKSNQDVEDGTREMDTRLRVSYHTKKRPRVEISVHSRVSFNACHVDGTFTLDTYTHFL